MNEIACRTQIDRLAFTRALLLSILLFLTFASSVRADSLSGTVKDPSGAVVVGARIEISGPSLAQPLVLTSDGAGRFTAPDLKPGKYSIRVAKAGFEDLATPGDLSGSADLPFNLVVASQ